MELLIRTDRSKKNLEKFLLPLYCLFLQALRQFTTMCETLLSYAAIISCLVIVPLVIYLRNQHASTADVLRDLIGSGSPVCKDARQAALGYPTILPATESSLKRNSSSGKSQHLY